MNILKLLKTWATICCFYLTTLAHAEVYTASFSNPSEAQSQRITADRTKTAETFYRVYDKRDIHVNKTTAIARTILIERFHSASDIQEHGQYTISLNPETEQLHILRASAVSPTGISSSASHEDIKVIDSNSYDVFSSQKEVLINIPALEIGGYALLEYEITTDKTKLEADWLEVYYPQVFILKKEYEFSANWDEGYNPSLFIETDMVNCTNKTNGIECKGSNIPALTSDSQVRWRDEIGYIHISDKSSWKQVAADYKKIFYSALASQDSPLLEEIQLNIKATTEEQISAIHRFVAQDIRYLSRSEYGNAFTPHPTRETLKKRQGDCKDKSALLVDLLRRIGVNAYPVLVSTHRKKLRDKIAPSLSQFNHVVVCFNLPTTAKEQQYCIDATDTDTPWKHVPSWIQGNFSLPLNTATPALIKKSVYRWEFAVETILTFNQDGGQTETQRRTYQSQYAAWLKNYINSNSADEVTRWLIDDYQQKVSNLSTPSMTHSGQDTMDSPIIIESKNEFTPFINTGEPLEYSEDDSWLAAELEDTLLSNKLYDEYFSGLKLKSSIEINLNNIWQLTLTPADLKLNHTYGSVQRTTSQNTGVLHVETTLEIPGRWVKVDEIDRFNNFLNTLRKELKLWVYGKEIVH